MLGDPALLAVGERPELPPPRPELLLAESRGLPLSLGGALRGTCLYRDRDLSAEKTRLRMLAMGDRLDDCAHPPLVLDGDIVGSPLYGELAALYALLFGLSGAVPPPFVGLTPDIGWGMEPCGNNRGRLYISMAS